MLQVNRERGEKEGGAAWIAKDKEVRQKENLGNYSWSLHHRLRGVPAVRRVHAVIDVAFLRAAKAGGSARSDAPSLQTPLYIEVSQCVARRVAAAGVTSRASSPTGLEYAQSCGHLAHSNKRSSRRSYGVAASNLACSCFELAT